MMTTRCPVCFALVSTPTCPTCGTDVRQYAEAQALEQTRLPEALHHYLALNRPQAAARIMRVLAEQGLREGQWRTARMYLEGIIALGEEAVGTATRATVQRELGGLVARLGDLDLAYHLLSQAQAAGDDQASLERVRLAVQQRKITQALRDAALIDAPLDVNLQAAAWLAEGLARAEDKRAGEHISAVLGAAELNNDPVAMALARRALGIWQVAHGDHAAAQEHLEQALSAFKELHNPYEIARTLVDLAHAVLLEPASFAPQFWNLTPYIERARSLLDEAVILFRKLGTPDTHANRLLKGISIERSAPPTDATSVAAGMIWLEVQVDSQVQQVIQETLIRQGGSADAVLDGWAIVFGITEPFEQPHVLLETAMALHEVILRLAPEQINRYRLVAITGQMPIHSSSVIHHTSLFKRARWQAAQIPYGTMCIENTLHMAEPYHFEIMPPSVPNGNGKQPTVWYRLLPPVPPKRTPIQRSQLLGYENTLTTIDSVLHKLQQKRLGGMVAISGVPGTGKSRLIDLYIQESKSTAQIWLIHLRGSAAQQHTPFGAIQQWLGTNVAIKANADPRERKLAYIASFRQSLLALLYNRPVVLVIDNIHLLDSASLQTLWAILPLIVTHPLIMLVTAQSEADDRWQMLIRAAQRAVPERTLQITLPSALAKIRHDLPADMAARRVLECAAVLGDRFPIPALRRMAGVTDLMRHLHDFQTTQVLVPTDDPYIWRFIQTAEREVIYENLLSSYRAMLHWYARDALSALNYPVEDHAHHAGIARIALLETLLSAESARQLDASQEALIHYDRALTHSPTPDVELVLARVEALLSLQKWSAAQETLQFLGDDLEPYDRARLLIYKGVISQQVGEIGTLLKLYEEAGSILRQEPADRMIQKEALRLIHAQAMARFKRGEMEIARSLIGSGLLQAEAYPYESAQLWELLASIHRLRREPTHARRAIEQALILRRSAEYHWLLIEPLETLGNLLAQMGEIKEAQVQLGEALDLASGVGDHLAIIRLRHRLGQLASYRGEFEIMIQHYQEALVIARFAEHPLTLVNSHAVLAEALAYKGDHVQAFYHAAGAVQLARLLENDQAGTAIAYIAQTRAALSAHWHDAALEAVEKAREMAVFTQNMILHLQIHLLRMEIALEKTDTPLFENALRDAREITPMLGDQLLRGRIALLAARNKANQHEWNMAVHEAERASETFAGLGASYWQSRADAMIKDLAIKAPDYVRSNAKYKM